MNLALLGEENPTWPVIRQFSEGQPSDIDALLGVVRAFDPSGENEPENEWIFVHALRILADREDQRLLPELARLLSEPIGGSEENSDSYDDEDQDFEDEDESDFDEDENEEAGHDEDDGEGDDENTLDNELELALENFGKKEHFEKIWALYLEHRDDDAGWSLLGAAANCKVHTAEFRAALSELFEEDPVAASWAMTDTEDAYFIPLLERRLTWLAPIAKYVPFDERIPEHAEWVECGAAWCALKDLNEAPKAVEKPAWTLRDYYEPSASFSDSDERREQQEEQRKADEDFARVSAHFFKGLVEVRPRNGGDVRDRLIDRYLDQIHGTGPRRRN